MKRTLLLLTALTMALTAVAATTKDHDVGQLQIEKNRYRFAQPIMFLERGIEFLVFPDGSFDFNTNYYDSHFDDNMYYKSNSRRSSIDVNYRGPNLSVGFTSNRNNGVYISRDRFGQVRQIDNIYINYDRSGKVTRVGSVFIDYGRGRNGTLRQVGGLRVNYNAWGEIVNVRGEVNRYQNGFCSITGSRNCNMNHNVGHHHDHNDWYDGDYDDNYYYYKNNGKVKKQKKMKR